MMNSRILSFGVIGLAVGLGLASSTSFAENWLTSPQLCRGKTCSERAREAQWEFDRDERVAFATKDSRTMYASVFPGEQSNFVLSVRVRLSDKAQSRLILGESTFDLTNSGTQTQLSVDGQTRTFENTDADSRIWTLLTIRRRAGKMTAEVNGHAEIDLGDNTRAIEKIGLQATNGRIAVQNFVLTGELERREVVK